MKYGQGWQVCHVLIRESVKPWLGVGVEWPLLVMVERAAWGG